MRVEQYLRSSAERYGQKEALVAGPVRLTYGEIDRASDRLAAEMLHAGVERHDRVLVFMDNCWEAVVSVFAVLKAGAVLSPINPSTKADKLAYILNNSGATAIITQGRLIRVVDEAANQAPALAVRIAAGFEEASPEGYFGFEDILADDSGIELPFAGIETDLAMLVYTSGSTGFPKGVMMTHQNVDAAARAITTYLENTSDDIILNVLPISFDYGLYQLLMAFRTGATLILEKSFAFPQVILNRLNEEKVTGFPIVPTMAALILRMKSLKPGMFPHLRYISSTGAALAPAVIEQLRTLFPDVRIYSMYGLTECKRCTWLPPEELDQRTGSVGIAIPGTEAFIVDDDGAMLPAGKVGELVIRGPHVMKGYWQDPEATAKALRPGRFEWEKVLHTGDLFHADEDGFLYFVSRKDDIIKTRGEKVSPKEVENVLYAMTEISEAAVLGVSDTVLGSALKAIVVAAPGANPSEKDVIRHCSRHLEDFMVPKQVEFRDALPKTESGKISRRLLQQTLEAGE
ncbi:class I adenylate-forming enzyme family protein [Hoeflea prorocentri]|uniref:Class I adenylate-forming enzyme family protein n=1 Tax=Hoeflea prorocentri TaxID=1922333 RepID=A0A9X3ZII1_9HYPH|nr:class I adenylate-forming enzyme family protein [Hoeflea prorocentri]MCY6381750.1 class I adenylate-forming enzyme family protein [Hoeflea prorocentri]MDA5399550.1 class I adenylate-forming enzyme family protein [Hoeflea prorocentri]